MKKLLLAILTISSVAKLQAQACSGAPAANTVVATATNICAGNSVTLTLLNPYTATGIVYQWASSTTSSIGPWVQVGGANNSSLVTTGITQSGWYTAVIACSNSFMTATATPVYINVGASGQTTTVPYYEGFENLTASGLPNCSWSASALGSNCLGFTSAGGGAFPCSGLRMLGFSYSATALGTYEFYSQGLVLSPGITYSAAVGQRNGSSTANNWSNFGIGIGTAQAAAGSTVVYSTTSPNSNNCALRSGTFTVPSSGTYYLRIYATAVTGTTIAQYLTFDDLSVTIPCNVGQNAASAVVSTTSTALCAGDSLLATFSPAANCTMSIGSNTTYIKSQNAGISTFSFAVTNSLTGCSQLTNITLTVNSSPTSFGIINPPVVCKGGSVALALYGGSSYTVEPGTFTSSPVVITPVSTTIFTITGANIGGCKNTSTVQVLVVPNPTVLLSPSSATVCRGDSVSLQASGALSYVLNGVQSGSQIALPTTSASTVFVITGNGTQGCKSTAQYSLTVQECLGFENYEQDLQVKVFPNPTRQKLMVQCDDAIRLRLLGIDGRLLLDTAVDAAENEIDLSEFNVGIYFLQVQGVNNSTTIRIQKE